MASFIGPLRSNDGFVWIKTTFAIFIHRTRLFRIEKLLQPSKGPRFVTDVALVLAKPFQPETILFRSMKVETTQLLFVQSVLNRSSDLRDSLKLARFRLFIYSKLEPKTSTIYGSLYISGKPRVCEVTRCVYFRNTANTSEIMSWFSDVCFSLS